MGDGNKNQPYIAILHLAMAAYYMLKEDNQIELLLIPVQKKKS